MKKKALALAVYMACATPTISAAKSLTNNYTALNLGEVKSKSFLGEPLKGYIPILFTSKKQAKKLNVRLAPRSIFAQAGTEKSAELDNLNFRISTRRGKPVIVVSSRQAMQLPILNFILEIQSSKGVIYQDYTIMLDPPKAGARKSNYRKKSPKTYFSPRTLKKYISKYRVRSGDSLSIIAKRHKRKGISLKRMMKSIYSANPRAFAHRNKNHLIKGVVLHIPSAKEIRNFSSVASKAKLKYKAKKTKKSSHKKISVNSYKVKRGDSLSKITKKFVYKGVSFTKMMRLIHKTNPHAFSRNRINQLKANVRLRIPTYTEVVNKKRQRTVSSTKQAPRENLNTDKSGNLNAAKTITNLQKRIRELRNELTTAITTNTELKESISNTESEKTTENSILISTKSIGTASPIQTALVEENHNTSSTQEIANELFTINNALLKEKIINANTDSLSIGDEAPMVDLSPVEADTLVATSKSASETLSHYLNANNISYGMLALLLGMGLLQYRKRKTTYSDISYEHAGFYPSHNENQIDQAEVEAKVEAEVETSTKVESTLEGLPNTSNVTDDYPNVADNNQEVQIKVISEHLEPSDPKPHTVKAQLVEKQAIPSYEITDKQIQECDLLIDELMKELATKIAHKKQSEVSLEKLSDQHIDTRMDINTGEQSIEEILEPEEIEHQQHDIITEVAETNIVETETLPAKDLSSDKLGETIVNILDDLEKLPPLSAPSKKSSQRKQLAELAHELQQL